MNHENNWAAILLILTALLIAATDLVFWVNSKPTYSQTIWKWSADYPVIPFLFGLLMGHLFW